MPASTLPAPQTLAPPPAIPSSPEAENGQQEHGYLLGTRLVLNEGSTARDYLARERTFLAWSKLTTTLAIISASLLIRFRFGGKLDRPDWEIAAERPLGILFFVATCASLSIGTHSFYSTASSYTQHKAFVYTGKAVDVLVVGIGLLVIVACVLLLTADG